MFVIMIFTNIFKQLYMQEKYFWVKVFLFVKDLQQNFGTWRATCVIKVQVLNIWKLFNVFILSVKKQLLNRDHKTF